MSEPSNQTRIIAVHLLCLMAVVFLCFVATIFEMRALRGESRKAALDLRSEVTAQIATLKGTIIALQAIVEAEEQAATAAFPAPTPAPQRSTRPLAKPTPRPAPTPPNGLLGPEGIERRIRELEQAIDSR